MAEDFVPADLLDGLEDALEITLTEYEAVRNDAQCPDCTGGFLRYYAGTQPVHFNADTWVIVKNPDGIDEYYAPLEEMELEDLQAGINLVLENRDYIIKERFAEDQIEELRTYLLGLKEQQIPFILINGIENLIPQNLVFTKKQPGTDMDGAHQLDVPKYLDDIGKFEPDLQDLITKTEEKTLVVTNNADALKLKLIEEQRARLMIFNEVRYGLDKKFCFGLRVLVKIAKDSHEEGQNLDGRWLEDNITRQFEHYDEIFLNEALNDRIKTQAQETALKWLETHPGYRADAIYGTQAVNVSDSHPPVRKKDLGDLKDDLRKHCKAGNAIFFYPEKNGDWIVYVKLADLMAMIPGRVE